MNKPSAALLANAPSGDLSRRLDDLLDRCYVEDHRSRVERLANLYHTRRAMLRDSGNEDARTTHMAIGTSKTHMAIGTSKTHMPAGFPAALAIGTSKLRFAFEQTIIDLALQMSPDGIWNLMVEDPVRPEEYLHLDAVVGALDENDHEGMLQAVQRFVSGVCESRNDMKEE